MDLKVRREELIGEYTKGQEEITRLGKILLQIEGAVSILEQLIAEESPEGSQTV